MTSYVASYRPPDPIPTVPVIKATNPPTSFPAGERVRLINEARRVKELYPGPAGEVLHTAILSYLEMGWLGRSDAAMQQLIDELSSAHG